MVITKVIIENYKTIHRLELEFNNDLNIIVGNNEAGKSTLLEAINLALTSHLNGKNVVYELTPYLFNQRVITDYIEKLRRGERTEPPRILIELYLQESEGLAKLRGSNNSKRIDATGIFMAIQFNEEYAEEYSEYISDPKEIRTIPTEYYEVKWYSFDHSPITHRSLPIKTTLIDATSVKLQNGTDYHVYKTISDILEKKEKAGLSITYRQLKEKFSQEKSLETVNARLKENKNFISERNLSVSIDLTHKSNWDSNLTSYLDEIPFNYIGKGHQNILKMVFALERKKTIESQVVLIEEPENHLSFSTMNKLIDMISQKCDGKQLILTTHSAFVLNKLGIEKLILLGDNMETMTLHSLSPDTQQYFKKLPGYDTLRLCLAPKTILVEGPSDELFVQKAYLQKHGKLPISNGIDVIEVRGLAFKRFLEIAAILKKNVFVVTDNDGDYAAVDKKYAAFKEFGNIVICCDGDETHRTLEPQVFKVNGRDKLNQILGTTYETDADLLHYLSANKTEWALKAFDSKEEINIPEYISHAIN